MTPQLYTLRASAREFLMRHHLIIFIILILLLLIAAATSLHLITTMSATTTAPGTGDVITGFDQKTVDQIKNLYDNAEGANKLVFPSPRSNPFVEK